MDSGMGPGRYGLFLEDCLDAGVAGMAGEEKEVFLA